MTDTAAYPPGYYFSSANPHLPFPEQVGDVTTDVCVVGGGFTGLSAALHLAERGYRVTLLEAMRIGWGASGRNGGQVGSGQRVDVLELEAQYGPDVARSLWELAEEAKSLLRQRIERHSIDCDYRPGNLLAVTKPRYLPSLQRETEILAERYGYHDYRMISKSEMPSMVASERYCAGRYDGSGGHLHPLNLALGLAAAAAMAGASIRERSRVVKIQWGSRPRVHTARGTVRARHVLLCGNGYLGALEPRLAGKVMPITNHILATEPLGENRARALIPPDCCVHASKFVVDYYRLSSDHRLLFGGGETYSERTPRDLAGFVRRHMLEVFPQLEDVAVEHAWSGRLAITWDRMPHFGRLESNGFFAHGFSGHGVALTQLAGRLLAEAVAGTAERFDVFADLRHRTFPGGALLRKPLLVAGMLYYTLRDRL